jgi:hypothetical protein
MTTGQKFVVVAIGNPTSKASQFFQCFHGKKARLWKNHKINCFDSPNLFANDIKTEKDIIKELEVIDALPFDDQIARMNSYAAPNNFLVTFRWVIERALEWGITHPLFRSKALAEFPEEDEKALFTLTQVTEATKRIDNKKTKIERRCIGVDPARFGTDKTIITVMEDEVVKERIAITKKRTTYVAGEVINLTRQYELQTKKAEQVIILVDGTGIGAGVVDNLHEASKAMRINARVIEVQFGASPADERTHKKKQDSDKEHFANFKAKIFHLLSKDLSGNIVLLADETDHEVYQDQLPSINYEFDSKGRLKIESKDAYKKRTGRHSPDESDSLAIANWGRHVKLRSKDFGPRLRRL